MTLTLTAPRERLDASWARVRDRFLSLIPLDQRSRVEKLLLQPRHGGRGLRVWLNAIAQGAMPMPAAAIPAMLIEVYLSDEEAMPAHDCAKCGLAVPVHTHVDDFDGVPERVYFPACPACGGHTGYFAHLESHLARTHPE